MSMRELLRLNQSDECRQFNEMWDFVMHSLAVDPAHRMCLLDEVFRALDIPEADDSVMRVEFNADTALLTVRATDATYSVNVFAILMLHVKRCTVKHRAQNVAEIIVRVLDDDERAELREYLEYMQREPLPATADELHARLDAAARLWPAMGEVFGKDYQDATRKN
jgi:hypothetical protein